MGNPVCQTCPAVYDATIQGAMVLSRTGSQIIKLSQQISYSHHSSWWILTKYRLKHVLTDTLMLNDAIWDTLAHAHCGWAMIRQHLNPNRLIYYSLQNCFRRHSATYVKTGEYWALLDWPLLRPHWPRDKLHPFVVNRKLLELWPRAPLFPDRRLSS